MTTTAGCLLEVEVDHPAQAVVSVAAAAAATSESLRLDVDGTVLAVREVRGDHGTRLHLADLPAGRLTLRYDVQLDPPATSRVVTESERLVALRPSRYCPSDLLLPWAVGAFGTRDSSTVERVVSWVRGHLAYDGTASRPVDSAVDTLLTARGVCRDYAHLVVAVLRALEVPARVVSVYAPGLSPMDFHAVAEVEDRGQWQLHDATGLAPRPSMLRIATGRDAADTAFLSTTGGTVTVVGAQVWASTDGPLPADAPTALA